MNKKGFSVYLTLLVTIVIFFMVTASHSIVKSAIDIGHSEAISIQAFHAADGGLERGIAKLRTKYIPFQINYWSNISKNKRIFVSVEAVKNNKTIDLNAKATIFEGNKTTASCALSRISVEDLPGRAGIGKFVEVS